MKLSLRFASFLALVPLAGAGCTVDPNNPDGTAAEEDARTAPAGTKVPNSSGDFDVSIVANGTGCPGGTLDSEMGADGETLTVKLSSFDDTLNPGQQIRVQDCTLQINLQSKTDRSFAVGELSYQGAAWLDSPGVTARQTAKAYFLGSPVPTNEHRIDMTGPYEDDYGVDDVVARADLG